MAWANIAPPRCGYTPIVKIDQLVYELYGLAAEEIAIVEDATRND